MDNGYYGRKFEDDIHNMLLNYEYKNNIFRELDVKRTFGSEITAIDHIVIYKNHYFFIQDKYEKNPPTITKINSFLLCCEQLKKKLNIKNEYHFHYIFLSKLAAPIKTGVKTLITFNALNICLNDDDFDNYDDLLNNDDLIFKILKTRLYYFISSTINYFPGFKLPNTTDIEMMDAKYVRYYDYYWFKN